MKYRCILLNKTVMPPGSIPKFFSLYCVYFYLFYTLPNLDLFHYFSEKEIVERLQQERLRQGHVLIPGAGRNNKNPVRIRGARFFNDGEFMEEKRVGFVGMIVKDRKKNASKLGYGNDGHDTEGK